MFGCTSLNKTPRLEVFQPKTRGGEERTWCDGAPVVPHLGIRPIQRLPEGVRRRVYPDAARLCLLHADPGHELQYRVRRHTDRPREVKEPDDFGIICSKLLGPGESRL